MTISMFDASVPHFIHALGNLENILEKGKAHAQTLNIDETILTGARLFPDMYPLSRQVQIACDMAKGCGARLAGTEAPKFDDTETSFNELIVRIQKTRTFLQTLNRDCINHSEDKAIDFNIRDRAFHFNGLHYLINWSIPNVYFHITTAYNILRHNGVALSKPDFLGKIQ